MAQPVVIGTRGSQLALWQAEWVRSALRQRFPDLAIELSIIKTQGDKILDVPLAKVGGKGLFVKEIEEALLQGRADLAVHSMKDMPSEIPPGLTIGAVPERETPGDILISRNGLALDRIPAGGRIGTSSLRRAAQLKHLRPDLTIVSLRGNVETRIRKLETDQLSAVVLAAAGVKRLGLEHRITEYLDDERMLPAVGQGALCIEIRSNDPAIASMVAALDHSATRTVVSGERAFLKRLQGGCQVPIAGHGRLDGWNFTLTGLVADVEGRTIIKRRLSGPAASAEKIGVELAEAVLRQGADEILKNLTSAAVSS